MIKKKHLLESDSIGQYQTHSHAHRSPQSPTCTHSLTQIQNHTISCPLSPPAASPLTFFSGFILNSPPCTSLSLFDVFLCNYHTPVSTFCLTALSLHISLNIMQYCNLAHIKSSQLPFIYQTSSSNHLAERKPLPRCHFMLLALALTCSHLHHEIVSHID